MKVRKHFDETQSESTYHSRCLWTSSSQSACAKSDAKQKLSVAHFLQDPLDCVGGQAIQSYYYCGERMAMAKTASSVILYMMRTMMRTMMLRSIDLPPTCPSKLMRGHSGGAGGGGGAASHGSRESQDEMQVSS